MWPSGASASAEGIKGAGDSGGSGSSSSSSGSYRGGGRYSREGGVSRILLTILLKSNIL